ncbi:hypothetical protein KIN20_030568 [Parelaphostrongylus tenuis]|uniref:K Homology domain-containing protein n=1 Tax=Parelaphostrongylus tenuis TaxID=148309 RepID=A0AAD5R411_PARTN|nr:hypothetical protein KIN20_030568 [Parelaphostrongylus tenuis]
MSAQVHLEAAADEQDRGEKVVLTETILVPVDRYPRYNFVGRILGPRGMTAKQLEEDTGCKIMVRGRGSSRTNGSRRERSNDAEPLHVLIQCEDYGKRAHQKMKNAVEAINQLLNPPPEGKDELKRKQLIELSIINGTYRPTSATKVALQAPRASIAPHLQSALNNMQYNEQARMISHITEAAKHGRKKCTLADPNLLSSLAQSVDVYGMGNRMAMHHAQHHHQHPTGQAGATEQIRPANLHQYLAAATLLNSAPFVNDGSGDGPKNRIRNFA